MRIIYLFIHLFMENASKTPYTPQSCAGVLWKFKKKKTKKKDKAVNKGITCPSIRPYQAGLRQVRPKGRRDKDLWHPVPQTCGMFKRQDRSSCKCLVKLTS